MSSLMRAIRDAAAAHGRNAEIAHQKALVNPKFARREVEEALQREERQAGSYSGYGGLKKARRLRVASDAADFQIFKARPPKGARKGKGGRKAAARAAPSDEGDLPPPTHSAVASDGVSVMYAPALQPMPRFMGAGPVANGQLLRSRAPRGDESDQWDAVGTV